MVVIVNIALFVMALVLLFYVLPLAIIDVERANRK